MLQTFTTDNERRVRSTASACRRGGRHATSSEQQTVEEPYIRGGGAPSRCSGYRS